MLHSPSVRVTEPSSVSVTCASYSPDVAESALKALVGAVAAVYRCRRRHAGRLDSAGPAPVAQWIERGPPEAEVAGSNPAGRAAPSRAENPNPLGCPATTGSPRGSTRVQ